MTRIQTCVFAVLCVVQMATTATGQSRPESDGALKAAIAAANWIHQGEEEGIKASRHRGKNTITPNSQELP